jgi:AcrR family transcriptional regulator
VTPTALYHYFTSKADLFAAAHEATLAVLLDAYRAAATGSRARAPGRPGSTTCCLRSKRARPRCGPSNLY